MAIRIPSSKTYDRQNPKVRDNVIERIEVGAKTVAPNNEYETPVYNEVFTSNLQSTTESKVGNLGFDYNGVTGATHYSWALISSSQSFFTVDLYIPKVKNNKYINKIYEKTKDNGENWIGVSVAYNVKKGDATAPVYGITYDTSYEMVSHALGEITKESPTETETVVGNVPSAGTTHSYIANSAPAGSQAIAISTVTFTQQSNISTITYDDTDPDFIKFSGLKILSGSSTIRLSYGQPTQLGTPSSITLTGTYVDYEAESIEITIYGNTIGIDLTDKTVYVPYGDKTSKKVFSVDGNELMQTTNQRGGAGALYQEYLTTQGLYAKGKETATIRCSVSDYYDYDSGEKVIAIDNSTGKMSFKMYDQVIPMVYGVDGKDRPMSTNKDGSPKVFQVLGSNIFYDGAVWQELSLQEA